MQDGPELGIDDQAAGDSEKDDFEDAEEDTTADGTKEKSPDRQSDDTDKTEDTEFFDVAEDEQNGD